jgi:hypothetical protein
MPGCTRRLTLLGLGAVALGGAALGGCTSTPSPAAAVPGNG